jgi:hypothetical protein
VGKNKRHKVPTLEAGKGDFITCVIQDPVYEICMQEMYHELSELVESTDVVRFMKSRRIAWLGHVMWMDEKRTLKRMLEWKPVGRIIRGRPRKRWIEDIEEDIQIMGIRGWRKFCKEREEWKRITEKAKPHSGL